MAKQKAPKPLTPITPGGAPYTATVPTDAEEAIKLAAKKAAKKAATKSRAGGVKDGQNTRVPVTFWFADSTSQIITVPFKRVIQLAIVPPRKAKDALAADVKVEGNKITGRRRRQALKSFQVSYGRKTVKRKKDSRNGATGSNTQVQAWITLSVPKAATLKDILQYVSTWRKQPAMIRYLGQDIMLDANRAIAGAGAVK